MGCTCSKASQPSRPPTLLEHRHQSALPRAKPTDTADTPCQATEGAYEGADVNVPSSVSAGATTAEVKSSLKPDVTMPVLEGEEDTSRDCSWFCCSKACRATTRTQSLESWELQLLQVSLELKMKLKDPHFVAKRCDLDSSGDLDMHELKQATRAFGMKFSLKKLQEFMAGEARITKERFAQIVTDAPVTSERSRPTIPHSLRGMALGQLQQLESIFITSVWLSAKCNAFNLEHADAIREGKKFPQAANLYAMDTFVVTPMSQPGTCDAREQDSAHVVPEANEKMSFSEVVNPYGLIVHCFVSHFWGHLFSQTVTALRRWAEMNCERIGGESPKSMVFWICLFALNQHAVADEVGENPMQGPFNAALAQAEGGAVMVLDEEINPFKRIWCLFEISRLKELNQPFELICEMGSLSNPESLAVQQADPAAVEELLQATCEALWQVSALKAKASVKEDQIRIWEEIANPGSRKLLKRQGKILTMLGREPNLTEAFFSEFDQFSQALLSSALLQFCLMHNHYAAAATCCEKGACFSKEQFAQINPHVREEDRTSWLGKLLILNTSRNRIDIVGLLLQSGVCMEVVHLSLFRAAVRGHEAATKLLLDHGANAGAEDINGKTVLMAAAESGEEAVTKLLLDHGADPAAADKTDLTALMIAATCGHVAVAKALLDHGADVAAADNTGKTVLMFSAEHGYEAVTKLLLDHGGDVAAAANNGQTALISAALGGSEAVTKLLLDHGGDVAATDEDGDTALIYAARGGHEAVAKALLDHSADVVVAANSGRTALMLAAQGGHEVVTKLLLDHGANVAGADKNGVNSLMVSAFCGHEAVARLLLDDGADVAVAANNGRTALMLAAQGGHEAMTKLLLDHGANVAAAANNGDSALHYAALGGSEAVAKALLDHGANVAAANTDGATALMFSAQGGHEAVAMALLDHGADVAAADKDGATALMASAEGGHDEVTQLLLHNGANVAAAANNGQTALIYAAVGGSEAVTKALLDHGADVAAANKDGTTALMVAAHCGHEAVTKALLDHGADVAAANKDGTTALMVMVLLHPSCIGIKAFRSWDVDGEPLLFKLTLVKCG
eukprot:symbB.v1.2.017665.t2/scaffold1380.1/size122483/3